MKTRTLASYLFLMLFVLALGCSGDRSEEGVGQGEGFEPAENAGTVVSTDEGVELCGGIEGLECSEGQFCNMPAGQCQVAESQGTCVYQPQACTKIYRPVCGCDGRTYGNDCSRLSAGVSKDYDGECKKQGG